MNAKQLRTLIELKGHSQVSAARAIGIAPRTMRRYVSLEDDYRPAPMPVLLALQGLKANHEEGSKPRTGRSSRRLRK